METRSLESPDSLITIKKRGFFLERKKKEKEKKNKSVLFSAVLVAKQLKGNEASFFFHHAEDCVWTEWDDVNFFKVRIETKNIRTQNNFSAFYRRQKTPWPAWGRCFPYCWLVIGCSNVIQSTIFKVDISRHSIFVILDDLSPFFLFFADQVLKVANMFKPLFPTKSKHFLGIFWDLATRFFN